MKLHVIVATDTLPVALMLSKGHLNDGPQGRILLRKLDGQFNGSSLLMDRAYEGNATRSLVKSLEMRPVFHRNRIAKSRWSMIKSFINAATRQKVFVDGSDTSSCFYL
ncbi:MAG: transposase [Thermoguttaceae bacterium]|nr:transposase [Thermoguttaceae bacterium]